MADPEPLKSRERTGFFAGGNNLWKHRNQRLPIRLVQPIGQTAAQQIVTLQRKCGRDATGVRQTRDRSFMIDLLGKDGPRRRCGNLKTRNEQDEAQCFRDRAMQRGRTRFRDRKTPKGGRRGVVRMSFELRA